MANQIGISVLAPQNCIDAFAPAGVVMVIGLGPSSSAPESRTLTINGTTPGEALWTSSRFYSFGGASIALHRTPVTTPAAAEYLVVPTSQRVTGDVHETAVSSIAPSSSETISRTVSVRRTDPAGETLTFGPIPSPAVLNVYDNNINRTRPEVRIQSQPEYNALYVATFSQRVGSTYREITVISSPVAIGAAMVQLRSPRMTGANSWNEFWELRDRVNIDWSVSSFGWDGVPALTVPTTPGTVVRSFTRAGLLLREP